MEATKPVVSLLLVCAAWLGGCTAEPTEITVSRDMAARDSAPDDGGEADSGPTDGGGGDVRSCPAGTVEICGNGCDDDGNGFIDDDDPACTPQVVATWEGGSSMLQRLVLRPPYRASFLDGNSVPTGAHGVYSRAFAAGVAFLAIDGVTMELARITLPPSGVMQKGAIEYIPTVYSTRDVCVFNGELIVVERAGLLHRLKADAKTENGTVQLPSWTSGMLLTSCATDGKYLYVSEHAGLSPSQFETLDTSFTPVASPSPMPGALLDAGVDRCLDFAWARGGFYGLFVNSNGQVKDDLPADELVSFAMDGAVGPPIDAGVLHGLGEYAP